MWDAFHLALEQEGADREDFLLAEFGNEPEQLAEIKALLSAHEDASGDNADSRAQIIEDLQRLDPENLVGETIGDYRIHELIGEGGMGLVYAAEQLQPIKRRVALKIIKLGMDTREVIARFESERQALALMEHPNVARILDAGATSDGRPYFVMDYVPGVAITRYADQAKLSLSARLHLFLEVCEAIQHAHQKGIIHRDLKPSNILINSTDGHASVKVIDFGVAKTLTQKLSDKTVYTKLGHFIGTPRYMSPEQAEMGALGVDTRSDVYSLGVVLFELLADRCPIAADAFTGPNAGDIPKLIREKDVPRPSTVYEADGDFVRLAARNRSATPAELRRSLERDLDWIVLKALSKERSDRYASVDEFASDIKRYFANEPVIAKPPATTYRVRKFVTRHRFGVGMSAAVLVALIAATTGLALGVIKANRALAIAQSEQQRSRASFDFLSGLLTRVVPDTARGEDARLLQSLLNEASATLKSAPPEDRRVVADLNQTLAESHRALGNYTAAQEHVAASLEIWREIAGNDSPAALRAENLDALVLWNQGKLVESERLFRDVLARQATQLGRLHPDSTATINNLALVLMNMGQSTEAMQLFEEVLTAQQAAPENDSNAILRTRFNMAVLMSETGQYDSAEPIARELSQSYQVLHGPDHPDTISAQALIARILLRQDRIDEADVVQRDALIVANATLGPEHRDTLGLKLIQGQILAAKNNAAAAENTFREVVNATENSPDEIYALQLPALLGLADVSAIQDKFAEAERSMTQADAIARIRLPSDNALRAIIAARLGTILLARERPAEAIIKLTECYPVLLQQLGASNEQTRAVLRDIVNTYEQLGQSELADQYRGEVFNTTL